MYPKFLLILFPLLVSFNGDIVHQDTPLELDVHGNIVGLPERFGTTLFDLKKGYLRIGNREVIFPSCIISYFKIHEKSKVELSASWYHSKEIMPYYLHFTIGQKGKDYSYSILVNLENLDLIEVSININGSTWYRSHRIFIEDYCKNEYINAINNL